MSQKFCFEQNFQNDSAQSINHELSQIQVPGLRTPDITLDPKPKPAHGTKGHGPNLGSEYRNQDFVLGQIFKYIICIYLKWWLTIQSNFIVLIIQFYFKPMNFLMLLFRWCF